MDNLIKEMENYAEEYNIPIMQKKGIDFLCKIIDKGEVKNILEIGTAIGYSAIKMANVNKDITVTSIERDQDRYIEALKNIKKAKLDKRINVIYGDALDINLEDKYDLIFIDAAKSQYIKFFNKYKENLNSKGIIISDNLSFHGFVEQKERIESRNLRQLVGKIRKYVDFLKDNKEFKTKFYKVGDGIAVSIKED
ncbi:MAG: O-methyltransferase [Bacilli bacterium]|nr:O-methyltransferase [Bacilli bacterium]